VNEERKDDKMTNDIYEQLADALGRLPNGFPRTPSNVEIPLLKKIFSPEEAWFASHLGYAMESVAIVAERVDLPPEETGTRLRQTAKRGLLWFDEQGDKPRFRLAPFIVGIYEAQLANMDHEFAHLLEEYMAEGGAVGIMQPQPALHRVVPTQNAVKSEWILPYDDVRAVLLAAKTFRARACICRVQQDHIGRRCTFPLKVCLNFSSIERPPSPDDVSQEEALAILDQTEAIGLVHTVSNVMQGLGYICNCCGCCCAILRGITDWGIEHSVAHANYYAVIDPEECQGCETCLTRCQVKAVTEQDGVAVVDRERCIGCGLCVTGCPRNAAQLQRKPDTDIVHPPVDFPTWEHERIHNRGVRV
jgi:ferredoxin